MKNFSYFHISKSHILITLLLLIYIVIVSYNTNPLLCEPLNEDNNLWTLREVNDTLWDVYFKDVSSWYKVEKVGPAKISGFDVYKFTQKSGASQGPSEAFHSAATDVKQVVHNYASNIIYDGFHKS